MSKQTPRELLEETVTVAVKRVAHFELDPAVGSRKVRADSAQIFYAWLRVLEIDLGDGRTGVLTTGMRAEGSFDPETDPLGPQPWNMSPVGGFEETVAVNERTERALGALLSGPEYTTHLVATEIEAPAFLVDLLNK